MTVTEAAYWAESRACKDCRRGDHDKAAHGGCKDAFKAAELIRALGKADNQPR